MRPAGDEGRGEAGEDAGRRPSKPAAAAAVCTGGLPAQRGGGPEPPVVWAVPWVSQCEGAVARATSKLGSRGTVLLKTLLGAEWKPPSRGKPQIGCWLDKIIELLKLEKTSKMICSNHPPTTSVTH